MAIEILISCDECQTTSERHASRLQAINEWQKLGGVLSPFSGDALCPSCYEKIDHPSMRSRKK
jgi:hypothetical protein